MGGYPPEFADYAGGAVTYTLFTVPSGVWRVVSWIHTRPATNLRPIAYCRRNGVNHIVAIFTALGNYGLTVITTPIVFLPGEQLIVADLLAATNLEVTTVGYVDVPIPQGGGGEFYRVKKG